MGCATIRTRSHEHPTILIRSGGPFLSNDAHVSKQSMKGSVWEALWRKTGTKENILKVQMSTRGAIRREHANYKMRGKNRFPDLLNRRAKRTSVQE